MDVILAGLIAAVLAAASGVYLSRRLNQSLAEKARAEAQQAVADTASTYVNMATTAWRHAEAAHVRATKLQRRLDHEQEKWTLALPLLEQCAEYWAIDHPEISKKIELLAKMQWTDEVNA